MHHNQDNYTKTYHKRQKFLDNMEKTKNNVVNYKNFVPTNVKQHEQKVSAAFQQNFYWNIECQTLQRLQLIQIKRRDTWTGILRTKNSEICKEINIKLKNHDNLIVPVPPYYKSKDSIALEKRIIKHKLSQGTILERQQDNEQQVIKKFSIKECQKKLISNSEKLSEKMDQISVLSNQQDNLKSKLQQYQKKTTQKPNFYRKQFMKVGFRNNFTKKSLLHNLKSSQVTKKEAIFQIVELQNESELVAE